MDDLLLYKFLQNEASEDEIRTVLDWLDAIGHSPPQILLGHTVRQTSTVFYLNFHCILSYL